MNIDVAHLSFPMRGERLNGDRPIFRTDHQRRALIAVIDGLGHGPGASEVAGAAAECLESISLETPVLGIMQQVHAKLEGSRGAAATVCLLRDGDVEACAVGNVELRSAELRLPLVLSAGILGVRVHKFRICQARISSPARLVLFSDGISSRVRLEGFRRLSPTAACKEIIHKYRRQEDDATVLVADVESI
jgi:negative regulator of sigma-B (phosphoserine phosphatase)